MKTSITQGRVAQWIRRLPTEQEIPGTCGPMDKAPAYGAGDSRFDPWHQRTCGPMDKAPAYGAGDSRTCGPMDKAPAYGAGDSRFDPWHVQYFYSKFQAVSPILTHIK
ncbi:hypothetical protein OUZ56_009116 [Daphnia magna]|uniref:Uncharacterized protein n=1 Tax=Daphnia magna TaxID=35525 RepID=A0ABR0AF21_9CRUS|nr:hypothetical protein OUZ56_009116 [Daphnia magna]